MTSVLSKPRTAPHATVGFRRRRRVNIADTLLSYGMLAPALVILIAFALIPLGWNVVLSLQSGGMLGAHSFVGFDNYVDAFQNKIFVQALKNTVLYAAIAVPGVIVVSLTAAILIAELPFVQGLFRSAVYLPVLVAPVIVGSIWSYIANRDFGPVNYLLGLVGLPQPDWLGSTTLAIPTIAVAEIWRGFGYYVLVFAAALTAVPKEFYEAARLDGAGGVRILRSITIPLLRPAIGFAVVMSTIWNLQLFDIIYVLTQGGPAGATSTVSWYVYQQAFQYDNVGTASTMSVILLLIIAPLSLVQLRFFRSQYEY